MIKGRVSKVTGSIIVIKSDTANPQIYENDIVKITKAKPIINDDQRKLVFEYYSQMLPYLKDFGHYSVKAFHENVKAFIESEGFLPEVRDSYGHFSLTILDRRDVDEFLRIVDNELMLNFFSIDTSFFWDDYEKLKG